MKKYFLLLIIILFSMQVVVAGNNTSQVDDPIMVLEDNDKVTALESGDSNISFSDGYKGYCAEWGEHSAEAGDEFYVHDDVDNRIRIFFVYYYDFAMKDTIATQHMIWKFTDDKEFSRFNESLYHQIIDTANKVHLNNNGKFKYNSTHYLVYDFKLFKAKILQYQNYIGVKLYFEKITNLNNTIILNSSVNKTNTSIPQRQNNSMNISNNKTIIQKQSKSYLSSTVSSHKTGNNIIFILINFLILIAARRKNK